MLIKTCVLRYDTASQSILFIFIYLLFIIRREDTMTYSQTFRTLLVNRFVTDGIQHDIPLVVRNCP